jgi:hypothetical protein
MSAGIASAPTTIGRPNGANRIGNTWVWPLAMWPGAKASEVVHVQLLFADQRDDR